MTSEGPYKKIM